MTTPADDNLSGDLSEEELDSPEEARRRHPSQWDEARDYGKIQPIETHPAIQESKRDRIVRECRDRGEPFFVVRAKDVLSVFALDEYTRIVERYAPGEHELLEGIQQTLDDFRLWQSEHRDQVRFPD